MADQWSFLVQNFIFRQQGQGISPFTKISHYDTFPMGIFWYHETRSRVKDGWPVVNFFLKLHISPIMQYAIEILFKAECLGVIKTEVGSKMVDQWSFFVKNPKQEVHYKTGSCTTKTEVDPKTRNWSQKPEVDPKIGSWPQNRNLTQPLTFIMGQGHPISNLAEIFSIFIQGYFKFCY